MASLYSAQCSAMVTLRFVYSGSRSTRGAALDAFDAFCADCAAATFSFDGIDDATEDELAMRSAGLSERSGIVPCRW